MEYYDFVQPDKEPLIKDTLISLDNDKLEQFRKKLIEYQARDRARRKGQRTSDRNQELIRFHRQMVLRTIIEIADTRDTIESPIWMAEVAHAFKQTTNIDVSKSLTVPLIVRQGMRYTWTMPDVLAIDKAAGSDAAAFADAYGLFCIYAAGRDDMIWNSTGLPPATSQTETSQ